MTVTVSAWLCAMAEMATTASHSAGEVLGPHGRHSPSYSAVVPSLPSLHSYISAWHCICAPQACRSSDLRTPAPKSQQTQTSERARSAASKHQCPCGLAYRDPASAQACCRLSLEKSCTQPCRGCLDPGIGSVLLLDPVGSASFLDNRGTSLQTFDMFGLF